MLKNRSRSCATNRDAEEKEADMEQEQIRFFGGRGLLYRLWEMSSRNVHEEMKRKLNSVSTAETGENPDNDQRALSQHCSSKSLLGIIVSDIAL